MRRRVTNRRGWTLMTAAGVIAAAWLMSGAYGVTPFAATAAEDIVVAEAESVGMSTERLQRINTFIQEYIDSDQIAGAVTLVARKGQVVHFEAQGWRDAANQVPMTKDDIFVLMSMTKPIVSSAFLSTRTTRSGSTPTVYGPSRCRKRGRSRCGMS